MSNLVFSRRAIQRFINDLGRVLTPEQLHDIVSRLNDHEKDSIAAMWEVVFLSVLSRMGALKHETQLPDGRRPDFESNVQGIVIVGDITAVSDRGLDEENPVEFLEDELCRLARRHRLLPNFFDLTVRGNLIVSRGMAKSRLRLPAKGALRELIRERVAPFVRSVAATPDQHASAEFTASGCNFAIGYVPGKRYRTVSHLTYTAPTRRSRNPLYNALDQKARQLQSAPDNALRMIIACDGGCDSLTGRFPDWYAYSAPEIVEEFFRQRSHIDLVLLVTVEATGENRSCSGPTLKLRCRLKANPRCVGSLRLGDKTLSTIEGALNQSVSTLPLPVRTPIGAARIAREKGVGPDMIGAYQRAGDRIRLSARAVQRLLAGEITCDQFAQAHGWSQQLGRRNPFLLALERGEMIAAAAIESAGDQDDDWIEFQFAKDAAVGKIGFDAKAREAS